MAFERPITIKAAINNVHTKKYLLPAIQREVVWDTERIERLFDSLMRDYPIGSFLFWMVKRTRTGDYQFYEFVRDYHERDRSHNPKAHVTGEDDIIGILDGQQRLTALYVGLRGSYAYKEPRKRWDNPQAFPTRRLYLNLRAAATDDSRDLAFDFRFLSDDQAQESNESTHWFKVGKILDMATLADVNDYLIQQSLMQADQQVAQFANRALFNLWTVIHERALINYYLEEDEKLDKVLNIFVRVNSGGVPLSHSDLLLSVAAAQWTTLDARETITAFVDDINGVGKAGFQFDKDWVLKSCLVLGDFGDIAFKVDNFNRKNMKAIEARWQEYSDAVRAAVTLVAALGYSRDTLVSNNAVIPIAYHLLQRGTPTNFDSATKHAGDRRQIHQWLIAALLKRVFGGQPDNVLRPMREVLHGRADEFPLDAIRDKFRGTTKSLAFTADDVELLLESRYGEPYTFSCLALLYPTLDFRNLFHVDHIHAKSLFRKQTLLKKGVQAENIALCIDNVDALPNLQLLEGIPNQEKNASEFAGWLPKAYSEPDARHAYMEKNYIPTGLSYDLKDFPEFFAARRILLRERLKAVLNVA
ncbi:MAG: DUF262 domain-containing protein [Vicinamibacterales bacterium]